MNIASVQWPTFSPYQKSTVEIYISGCTNNCKGCHNSYLSDFHFGEVLDTGKLNDYLLERYNFFDIISFTGGDPLCKMN
jgi:organic radical activating enzyme